MKRVLLGILIATTFGFAANSLLGNESGDKAPFLFEYYPELNLYHDVAEGAYIYPVQYRGKQIWERIPKRTDKVPATLGESITIRSNNPDIWKDNSKHLQQYRANPGQLSHEPINSNRKEQPAGPEQLSNRKVIKEQKGDSEWDRKQAEWQWEREKKKKEKE